MCGVIFPHPIKLREKSVTKCCGYHCAAAMTSGKRKPIATPDEIEVRHMTKGEIEDMKAEIETHRLAMRQAGMEAKKRAAEEEVSKRTANRHAATHERVMATRVEKTCKKCAKVFYVSLKESEAGRGKHCSRDCQRVNVMRPARNIKYVPRPAYDPATTLDGKLSFTTLPDLETAIGQLMARGYSFRTPGRAFDVNPPVSDFYGLQWGKDEQKKAMVFFYTTKPNTFKYYASR